MVTLPPQDPPDGGGSLEVRNQGVSFKDKLVGCQPMKQSKDRVNLLKENLARMELLEGDRLYPKFTFEREILDQISKPWKDALVVKLLGRNVGYFTMKDRLQKLWKPSGGFDIIDLDYGFFLVKFDEEVDRSKVVEGGPWMLFDHYLAVRTWSRDFVASSAKVDKTLVWIRFPCLNLAYYDADVLFMLANGIGVPVKIDHNTMQASRGKFTRVCVEIDLTKPVVGCIMVEDEWYKVEYEGLHIISVQCGCYGHHSRDCSNPKRGENQVSNPQSESGKMMAVQTMAERQPEKNENIASSSGWAIPENPHGDWLIVRKPRRKSRSDNKGKAKIMEENRVSNSSIRFDGLREDEGTSKQHAEEHVQMDNNEEAYKSCGALKGNKWVPVKVKKKVISSTQLHKAKTTGLGRTGQNAEAHVQATPIRANEGLAVQNCGNTRKTLMLDSGKRKVLSIADRTSRKEKELLKGYSLGAELKGVVKKHKASKRIVPSISSSLKML